MALLKSALAVYTVLALTLLGGAADADQTAARRGLSTEHHSASHHTTAHHASSSHLHHRGGGHTSATYTHRAHAREQARAAPRINI